MKAEIFERSEWIEEVRPDVLMARYNNLLKESGFNVCGEIHKFFSPFGFTAVFILAESHFAIHTFPEEGKSYIQLSSCVKEYFDRFWESSECLKK